jgi:CRP-like cAMP-binding protein
MMTALGEIAAIATSSTFLSFLQDSLQMSPNDWDELFEAIEPEQHETHAIIVQEDQRSDALFYITKGMVTVERASLQLSLLAPGDWFGEYAALLGQSTATASIVAQKNVAVRRLHRSELLRRIWLKPALGVRIVCVCVRVLLLR